MTQRLELDKLSNDLKGLELHLIRQYSPSSKVILLPSGTISAL